MIEIQREITNEHFILNYKNLYVIGLEGVLENSLGSLGFLCGEEGLEFTRVHKYPDTDFLSGFYYPPAVDITLDRFSDKESAMVTYSLQKEKTLELLGRLAEKSRFNITKPSSDFIGAIGNSLGEEIFSYNILEKVSEKLGLDFAKTWALPRYFNFLERKSLSEEDSAILSALRLGLPKNVIRMLLGIQTRDC